MVNVDGASNFPTNNLSTPHIILAVKVLDIPQIELPHHWKLVFYSVCITETELLLLHCSRKGNVKARNFYNIWNKGLMPCH